MMNSILRYGVLVVLTCMPLTFAFGQDFAEAVRIQGSVAEDVYAAGGTVDVHAAIDGDLVVAGGRVTVSGRVTGDVMAAGGTLGVYGDVIDDVRLAGGDVTVDGSVAGDAIAAGGNVVLGTGARVGGRAWLGGARVEVAGTVGEELKAAGERIVISGRVNGDVTLEAGAVEILDGAVIEGSLIYRSPSRATIGSDARITGTVDHVPVERHVAGAVAWAVGFAVIAVLGLVLTGGTLYLLFPGFTTSAIATIRAETWKCLGLGLAAFAATPVIVTVLSFTLIGWLPAIVIGTLYLLLLLAGFLTGIFFVGDLAAARGGRAMTRAKRLWSYAIALVVVLLLGIVPVLGTLALLAVLLLGVGALELEVFRAYTGRLQS